jgi:hypothetical protein
MRKREAATQLPPWKNWLKEDILPSTRISWIKIRTAMNRQKSLADVNTQFIIFIIIIYFKLNDGLEANLIESKKYSAFADLNFKI